MKKILLTCVIIVATTVGAEVTRRKVIVITETPVYETNEQLIKSANAGEASAQYTLGMCYYDHGRGLETNFNETATWFFKAAEQGHAKAQAMYGECMDVAGNWKEAAKWYLKAAEQGSLESDGLDKLAKMYADGRGVEKNWVEAVKWYLKLYHKAEKEIEKEREERRIHPQLPLLLRDSPCEPALAIADIFAKGGWGVEKDEAKAFEWYHKAAEEGSSDAMLTLGEMYFYGRGVAKDAEEAVKWYHRAAKRSNAKAYYRLADCYMHGDGVYEDMVEAMKWRLKWFRECHRDFYFFGTFMLPVGLVLLILVVIAIVKKFVRPNRKQSNC